jgi:hypothetical protein
MFAVTEAEAAAIRATFEQQGELSAAIELRRLFPGITDNVQARECGSLCRHARPGGCARGVAKSPEQAERPAQRSPGVTMSCCCCMHRGLHRVPSPLQSLPRGGDVGRCGDRWRRPLLRRACRSTSEADYLNPARRTQAKGIERAVGIAGLRRPPAGIRSAHKPSDPLDQLSPRKRCKARLAVVGWHNARSAIVAWARSSRPSLRRCVP